jgi:DNA-directed RNA polymerase specialized sigma24 family protein
METIEAIVAKKEITHNETEMMRIYERAFPSVAGFVRHMGGNLEDAKDIFHDALVIYFEATWKRDLRLHKPEEAYILGIAKHLRIRKYHLNRSVVPLSDAEKGIAIPEDYFSTINDKRLLRFLELAGRKCMDLLKAVFYQSTPIKDLVKALGYGNEHTVSVQKYKCLEKVRNIIKEKSLAYEDFLE